MYMTMKQIQSEYDGQWVFMINCECNQRGSVIGGEVVLHSENRNNVVRKMVEADNGTGQTFIGYVGKGLGIKAT